MSKSEHSSLLVGDLLVEPESNKVTRDANTVKLRSQVMELLVFLSANPGRVVSVEELLDSLWAGKVVTEGTLYNCIGELRHAISSLDDTQPYIENIPKKGYRLSVTVEHPGEQAPSTGAEGSADAHSIKRPGGVENQGGLTIGGKVVLLIVIGLFVAVAATYFLDRPRDVSSIAVLPFEDNSPGGDQAYLGNGIADELRLELQRLDGLRVAGGTSSIAFVHEDGKTIADLLNVDAIIEGSVRKDGDTVRITVQLTNAVDGFTIWSESYNRKLETIFELQEEIATSVAGVLHVRLGVGGVNAFRGAGTRNVEAYEAFLKAQILYWEPSGLEKSTALLERAIELDPNYAAAWSALATNTYSRMWDTSDEEALELSKRAEEFALRGVQIDPDSAIANSVLAMIRMIQFDWIGAEQGLRRATEMLADLQTLARYGFMLMRSGRLSAAQQQFAHALTVEPMGGRPVALSWHASLAQGRIGEAKERRYFNPGIDLFEDQLDIAFNEEDPEVLKAAIRGLPEMLPAKLNLFGPLLAEFDSPERVLSILRDVYRDDSVKWPRKLHDIAMAAVYFGDPEFALQVKARDIRTNPFRMVAIWYPVMSDVRRLPGFKDLVTELNLVEYWRQYGWADYCRPLGDEDFECF